MIFNDERSDDFFFLEDLQCVRRQAHTVRGVRPAGTESGAVAVAKRRSSPDETCGVQGGGDVAAECALKQPTEWCSLSAGGSRASDIGIIAIQKHSVALRDARVLSLSVVEAMARRASSRRL